MRAVRDRLDLRAAAGRADLVRLLRSGEGTASAAILAERLGYRVVAAVASTPEDGPAAPAQPEPPAADPIAPQPQAPAHVWRVVAETQHDLPLDEALPPLEPLPAEGGNLLERPRTPDLTPWRALWPRIYDLVARQVPGHAPDLPRLVRHLACGRPLTQVPRRLHQRWPERLSLWIDRHLDRVPIWDDQDMVRRHLARWCPTIEERCAPGEFTLRRGESALLLGDLSAVAGSRRHARMAEHRGAHLAALTPRPCAVRGWQVALWQTPLARQGTAEERAERLLALAVHSVCVLPGQLRALRMLLPAAQADVTTELDVWLHRSALGRAADGLVWDPAQVRERRRVPDPRCGEVTARWHRHLPQSIRHQDALLGAGEVQSSEESPRLDPAKARAFFEGIKTHLLGGRAPELEHYARMASDQLVSAMDHHPDLKELVNLLWHAGHPGAVEVVPEGIDPALAHRVRPGAATVWHLLHAEGGLRLAARPRGVVLARVRSTQPVAWVRYGEQRRQQRLDTPIDLDDTTRIELATDLSTVVLEKLERPAWAEAFGVERGRAWAELQMDGAIRRLWAEGAGWAGEGGYGADGFGVFHVAEVKGQRLRMRLIPAGEFLMGSPKDDREGFDDERPQHMVRLTQSFWLADVPVTQAVWQAVMGRNPAHFEGLYRPVEEVSWDGAQAFIKELGTLQPGRPWRLPTEAQWEYACRAGTTTPRYGELDEVAWWSGNSGRQTQPVGQKRPNAWGLHDMLGNVWEWCADWFGGHKGGMEIDPSGPQQSVSRVVRGGSWRVTSRRVRADYRFAYTPGDCSINLGFRLSRGHAPPPTERSPLAERGPPGRLHP